MNITKITPVSGEIPRHLDTKERIAIRELIAFKDGKFKSLLTARWYMGKSREASVVYCALWVTLPEADWGSDYACAAGQAGGHGYCKQSAAYEDALNKAGIKTSDPISGRGMSVVEESLEALARNLGYNDFYISRG